MGKRPDSGRPRLAPPRPRRTLLRRWTKAARILGFEPMPHQLEVARYANALQASGRWAYSEIAWVMSRQNGKSSYLVPGICERLTAGSRILHTAQNRALPREVFVQVAQAMEVHYGPILDGNPRTANGQEMIRTLSGGVYRIVAPTSSGARGTANDLLIVDELRQLPDWDFVGAARATMAASANPQVWYLSNAGDEESRVLNAVRERAGVDPQLAYLEWSAAPERPTEDRAGWAEANPALGRTISWEFLESAYVTAKLEGNLSIFETEHLCRWVRAMGKRIVPDIAWERGRAELEAPRRPALGVAVSGSRASAVLAWMQSDQTVGLTIAAEVTGSPLDLDAFAAALKAYASKSRVTAVGFDPSTDRDLMRALERGKALNVQELEAASLRFAAMTEAGRIRWSSAEPVSMDLPYLTRQESTGGRWRAVARSRERPATAALAAIRAVYMATEPRSVPRVF